MRAAGLGFNSAATAASLRDALDRAGGVDGLVVLATAAAKADAGPLRELAATLGLPIRAVTRGELATAPVLTRSTRVAALYGTGSVAEAAAVVAAGPAARLVSARAVSADGHATAAIADREGP
ncbi:MAG: cobalamin biosynthesis protein [Hyphomicrobiaceae bacterium]|nr:cobalamin biosynthesis protein [Hyphomicrobiaceae bacterium]